MIKVKTEPVKVLYFVDRMLRGGIQSLVIDWVSRFDKNKIHVDFLLLDDGKEYELEQTLKELGCTVYKLKGIWVKTPIDFIKYKYAVKNFFKEHHDYKVVHMHSSSKNYMILKYAEKYGIPIRIAHAHATDFQTNSNLKKIIGNIFKKSLTKYSTDFFACSYEAGHWLFGYPNSKINKLVIIKNGIDYKKFSFNKLSRNEIREEYNISKDDILLGSVGRFVEVKNHEFMIELMSNLIKFNSNYKLMLVGDGMLRKKLEEKVVKYNLEENVVFVGFRNDAFRYLNAFDIFLMPSLYEGLGLALIEAQANGLPCIATSKTIPNDVNLSKNFHFLDLDLYAWENQIKNTVLERQNNYRKILNNGFLIEESVDVLLSVYLR